MAKLKTLKNGRSSHKSEAFSRATIEMQQSPAFQSLAASSLRVLLWAIYKNYRSASAGNEGSLGRPKFKLTNSEARRELGMNQTTYTRAKNELFQKGFIVWVSRGGLKGANGIASEFALSGDYKNWIRPPKKTNNPFKPRKTPGKTINSVKQT